MAATRSPSLEAAQAGYFTGKSPAASSFSGSPRFTGRSPKSTCRSHGAESVASIGSFCAFAEEQATAFRLANPLPYFTRVSNKYETRKHNEWRDVHFTACKLRTTDMLLDAREQKLDRERAQLAEARRKYLREAFAVTAIQRVVRGVFGRRRAATMREKHLRRHRAAVQIQTRARGIQARARCAKIRADAAKPGSSGEQRKGARRKSDAASPARGRGPKGGPRSPKGSALSPKGGPASPKGSPSPKGGTRSPKPGGRGSASPSPAAKSRSGKFAAAAGDARPAAPVQAKPPWSAEDAASRLLEAFAANPPALRRLQESMQEQPPLRRLCLEQCALGEAGAVVLAKALLRHNSLRVLDLKGNYIGCTGVQRLAAGLEECPKLARLGLGWNSVGDTGATRVANALYKMSGLKDLDLSYNRITDSTLCTFMEVFQASESVALKQLDLRSNQFWGTASMELRVMAEEKELLLHMEGPDPEPLEVIIPTRSSTMSKSRQQKPDRGDSNGRAAGRTLSRPRQRVAG